MTSQPSVTESAERSGTPCPVCDAAAQRGQLVCLECGSRITLAYRRPPGWKLPVAVTTLILLLAVVGAAVAFQALDDDAKRETSAAPAQPKETAGGNGARQDGATPGAADEDTASGDATAGDEPQDRPSDRAQRPEGAPQNEEPSETGDADELVKSGDLYAWPSGLSAFTVVLLSSEDRPSATSFAQSAGSSPSNKVGVIRSNDFKTLPQNFFVVFAGQYDTRGEADRAASRLGGRFPGAFAQLVRP